ncbi:MAG TPA: DUF2157 domain-containing protein [Thermoanaerobaculia bacterium]|nr:DUF2157 domain-containing protein [Thermoanaerobaculia bacterium]
MDERKVLDRHLAAWREAGLVAPELESRLRASSEPLLAREGIAWTRWALALLGGGLVLAGLILIVAENWELIPRWGKLAGWAALQIGFLLAAHESGRRFERPYLAEAFTLLAGGWVLAGIALVSQIFHLNSRPANGLWFWLVLILPAAWLLPRVATAVVAFVALVSALIAEIGDPQSLVAAQEVRSPWLWLAVPLLAIFAVSWLPRPAPWLRSWVGAWVFANAQFFLLAFGVSVVTNYFNDNRLGNAWIVAAVGLVAAAAWPARTLPVAWGNWGARGILGLSLLPWILLLLAIGGEASDALRLFAVGTAWVTQILAALLLIRVANRSGSALWVNLGFLALAVGILTRYFDLFGDYLQGGAALAMTGVLVLVILAFLESARRRTLRDSPAAPLAASGGQE